MKILRVLAFVVAGCPAVIWADGGMWKGYNTADMVLESHQSAWIEHDGRHERLTIAVRPSDVSERVIWMFPVPAPASQTRLSLIQGLPAWEGEEVRLQAANQWRHLKTGFLTHLLWPIAPFVIVNLGGANKGTGLSGSLDPATHVELGGLVSELVAPASFQHLNEYLRAKRISLPSRLQPLVETHLKEGASFVLSWAAQPRIEEALAVQVDFATPRTFYPMRLTSVYGKAVVPVDVRINGWVKWTAGAPRDPMIGYYRTEAGFRYTRVLVHEPADTFTQDWVFQPRWNTSALHFAGWVGTHPFAAYLILYLALSWVAAWVILLVAGTERSTVRWPALLLGSSQLVPLVGPWWAAKRLSPLTPEEQAVVENLRREGVSVSATPLSARMLFAGFTILFSVGALAIGTYMESHPWNTDDSVPTDFHTRSAMLMSLSNIDLALERFHLDWGHYPHPDHWEEALTTKEVSALRPALEGTKWASASEADLQRQWSGPYTKIEGGANRLRRYLYQRAEGKYRLSTRDGRRVSEGSTLE